MITLKSPGEIGRMHEAGRLLVRAHQAIRPMLEPGVTTGEIDATVERLLVEAGAKPLLKRYPGAAPFPAATCISVNDEAMHGVPGRQILAPGDLVSVDIACRLHGWCCDAAWTYPVGEIDAQKRHLIEIGVRTLQAAVREMAGRATWSQVARRMEDEVRRAGFSIIEECVGHGIGRELHEDPQAPAYVSEALRRNDFRLEPGLVLAVEPVLAAGRNEVRVLGDGWTVVTCDRLPAAHFEHTIAVTTDGPVVLTEGMG